MLFFILFFIISFFIFLFCLYKLGQEDLILIRRNVTLEYLFNLAFSTSFMGLVGSRLIYIILHFSNHFLSPIIILAIPYFPGLSFLGGILGGGGYIYYISKLKKYPAGRLADFFSLSVLCALPFALLGSIFLYPLNVAPQILIEMVCYIILFFFFIRVLYRKLLRGSIRDGSIGTLFVFNVSLISLVLRIIFYVKGNVYRVTPEDIFTLIILLIFLFLFLRLQIKPTRKKIE